ncbi:MAG: hypothetical protein RL264_2336 [Bacteroidota bacterium]|jgi:F-type H+-transporting ATPase subunit b
MDPLVLPDLGLLFWTGIVFCILLFLLAKFAWKPILSAVNAREQKIAESLELAEKTKAEMQALQAENEKIMKEARAERDTILREAKDAAINMVEEAKNKARIEADKVIENARHTINSEKAAAMAELKTQVASLSLSIAEKVVRGELAFSDKQKALAEQLANDINLN